MLPFSVSFGRVDSFWTAIVPGKESSSSSQSFSKATSSGPRLPCEEASGCNSTPIASSCKSSGGRSAAELSQPSSKRRKTSTRNPSPESICIIEILTTVIRILFPLAANSIRLFNSLPLLFACRKGLMNQESNNQHQFIAGGCPVSTVQATALIGVRRLLRWTLAEQRQDLFVGPPLLFQSLLETSRHDPFPLHFHVKLHPGSPYALAKHPKIRTRVSVEMANAATPRVLITHLAMWAMQATPR